MHLRSTKWSEKIIIIGALALMALIDKIEYGFTLPELSSEQTDEN
ncbi:MAG TPA: hypothetical protein VLX29_11400 [Nitrospirota bacterium]|nr:hypothetical protein [Nitrospirota bacterium]